VGNDASRARSKNYKTDTGRRFWRVTFLRLWRPFLHLLRNPKLRLFDEHLVGLRVLEIEPVSEIKKYQGRRFPTASISQAFSIRRLCASDCLAESIQLIKSLRSIGVSPLH
jgi:hypothetical protein